MLERVSVWQPDAGRARDTSIRTARAWMNGGGEMEEGQESGDRERAATYRFRCATKVQKGDAQLLAKRRSEWMESQMEGGAHREGGAITAARFHGVTQE